SNIFGLYNISCEASLLSVSERLVVSGAPKAVSARVGDDVTLGCSVDSHVPPEKMEKVVWKRPDQDVIVLLYKGGEVLHDSSHERYRGRAEFFPAEIHKGNFSLRLKEVRTEDEGDFMCEVHTSLLSASLHVKGPSGPLQVQLGDSVLLPCSVRTPVPLEELEVEWRRSDSETLVLLFQDGEERGEEPEFRNRAHFFTEEISRGNFSLFLTDAVSARVGDDVTLGCSVDSHVPPERMEKVVWKRPDQDVIVLLYKGGEVLHDSSHERYRGRAEFFPAEIHKGNFSLRLKEVRTEDEGDFMCEVHTSLLSASTTVLLWYFLPTEMFHVSVPAVLLCLLALAVTVGLSFPVGTSLWKEPPVPSRTDNDQEENHSAVDGNAGKEMMRTETKGFHLLKLSFIVISATHVLDVLT
uniref:Ig-like domain-containing protein n=1 Tax=Denticeps clupeoides TaxID=299321 RepID=A0AAY4DG75_9TELE